MDELIIRNVRCFSDPGSARIAPITLLVGENSTGKTTFLALTRLAWDTAFGSGTPDFNDDPFFLGGYDQIAHFHGGRVGRARTFEIAFKIESSQQLREKVPGELKDHIVFNSTFIQRGPQPILKSKSITCGQYKIVAQFVRLPAQMSIVITTPSGSRTLLLPREMPRSFLTREFIDWDDLLFLVWRRTMVPIRRGRGKEISRGGRGKEISEKEFAALRRILQHASLHFPLRPYAIAPIRTKPERTYNPIKDIPTAEGIHVPMVLAKSYIENREEWHKLRGILDRFGESSGLFEDIRIKPLGKTVSDPFQIRFKIFGPAANLIDVGYGVSQVLPILVDAIRGSDEQMFLLQQPEVHLHPRGQAQLSSFLCLLAKQDKKKFVIETHSDYMIDRICMDVRDGNFGLRPDDVSILFFNREGSEIVIHNISLDQTGNLVDAPLAYRQFFLEEERRFFGMEKP